VTEEQIRMRLESLDYYRLLSRSKIAVSVRGGGFDTYRYWEIVACKALLVSERPDIVIPNNYEHRRHAVFCKPDLSDLGALIRYYAAHEDERRSIVEEGYAHLLKYHTCERRAEYFLDICRRYV
jgi:spore maturation protein CgeB